MDRSSPPDLGKLPGPRAAPEWKGLFVQLSVAPAQAAGSENTPVKFVAVQVPRGPGDPVGVSVSTGQKNPESCLLLFENKLPSKP